MQTRREFLKNAAVLSGAAGATGSLLSSIHRAREIEPTRGSIFLDAEHVVILMQENRSFDHAFGTLRGVRGFNDPRAIRLANGNPVWVQTNDAGASYAPFRLNIKETSATWMGTLPHSWTDQVDARNGGRYDRWLQTKRSGNPEFADMPLTLGYYNREDIPFYYELADAFTICDQSFCSCLTGTTPNRLHLWTGTIRAKQEANSPANVLNSDCEYGSEVSWPTFLERLEDHGVSWKIYQNELTIGAGLTVEEDLWLGNFGDNPIEWFTQFNVRFAPAHRRYVERLVNTLPAELVQLKQRASSKNISADQRARVSTQIAEKSDLLRQAEAERSHWTQQRFDALSSREKSLHKRAFSTNVGDPDYHDLAEMAYRDDGVERLVRVPKGDVLHQFRKDVLSGNLPTVSWAVPPEKFSDHPDSAWYGPWYVAEMLDILTQNPDVWRKTIFILTYDENDGYFDHAPPFVAPHPRRPETGLVSAGIDTSLEYVDRQQELERKPADEARDSPIGLGYRVPLIIASPWTRGGCVCSQIFDHTSPLQFLERFVTHKTGTEIREPNINQWRRTVCGNLTSAFQADVINGTELPAFPERNAFIEQIHRAKFKDLPAGFHKLTAAELEQLRHNPSASHLLPQQEPGVRRACALPYELSVDGALASDRRSFVIDFAAQRGLFGDTAAGSPFVVYARHGGDELQVRNYAVKPGDRLSDSWSLAEFENEHYELSVYGPNGFFREFSGDVHDPDIEVRLQYGRESANGVVLNGNVEILLANRHMRRNLSVELWDNSYQNTRQQKGLAPGATAVCTINTQQSFGWYDITVRIEGSPRCAKRYAGHVETGNWSYSDPAMGRVVTT
jgi:phospholipase C